MCFNKRWEKPEEDKLNPPDEWEMNLWLSASPVNLFLSEQQKHLLYQFPNLTLSLINSYITGKTRKLIFIYTQYYMKDTKLKKTLN